MPSISTVRYIGTVTVVARDTDPTYTYITNNTTETISARNQNGDWSVSIAAGQTASMRGVNVLYIMVPGGSSITVPYLNRSLNTEFKYKMFN